MINTILFDLDGTILQMDTDEFVNNYYNLLMDEFGDLENVKEFFKEFNNGYLAMRDNQSDKTNKVVFEEYVISKFPELSEVLYQRLLDFYSTTFNKLGEGYTDSKISKQVIEVLVKKGYKLVLATNPVFPLVASKNRLSWIGLNVDDFEFVTTIENCKRCKPSIEYFNDVLKKVDRSAEQCLMIGNDEYEDLVASELGIKTYLVEDHVIRRENVNFKPDFKGSLEDLLEFCKELPKIK